MKKKAAFVLTVGVVSFLFMDWLLAGTLSAYNKAKAKGKSTCSIRIVRADGTIEDLGIVSQY